MTDTVNPTPATPPPPGKKTLSTFRALHYSSFRYMWLGQLGNSAAMWMEQVVRPLLVLEMTGSALQVGLVITVRMVPQFIFGLFAGVLADRYNKQRILMISQSVTMAMHLVLASLLLTNRIEVWHIFVTAFISGASMAFNQPARQAIIPRLVPDEILLNALALNTAAMNIMRIVGAGLAGVLLIFFNYGQVYLLNAALFIGVLWTTAQIKETYAAPVTLSPANPVSTEKRSYLADFVEGFRYIVKNKQVLYLVAMALLLFVFVQPYQQVFVPLLALEVLDVGSSGAGWMLALTGVGALISSLIMASVKRLFHRGLILIGFLVICGIALILLAQSTNIFLSGFALILAGSMTTAYLSLNTNLLLEQSTPVFHGRVMSFMSLDRGLVSVGAILAGGLAEGLGPQTGLTIIAITCIAITVLAFLFVPALRKID